MCVCVRCKVRWGSHIKLSNLLNSLMYSRSLSVLLPLSFPPSLSLSPFIQCLHATSYSKSIPNSLQPCNVVLFEDTLPDQVIQNSNLQAEFSDVTVVLLLNIFFCIPFTFFFYILRTLLFAGT